MCPELRAPREQHGHHSTGTAGSRCGVHLQPHRLEGRSQGGGHQPDSRCRPCLGHTPHTAQHPCSSTVFCILVLTEAVRSPLTLFLIQILFNTRAYFCFASFQTCYSSMYNLQTTHALIIGKSHTVPQHHQPRSPFPPRRQPLSPAHVPVPGCGGPVLTLMLLSLDQPEGLVTLSPWQLLLLLSGGACWCSRAGVCSPGPAFLSWPDWGPAQRGHLRGGHGSRFHPSSTS